MIIYLEATLNLIASKISIEKANNIVKSGQLKENEKTKYIKILS